MIVKSIVYEKELRLKQTMQVMGLRNFVFWIGWFIDSLLPMIVTIFILTFILVVIGYLTAFSIFTAYLLFWYHSIVIYAFYVAVGQSVTVQQRDSDIRVLISLLPEHDIRILPHFRVLLAS